MHWNGAYVQISTAPALAPAMIDRSALGYEGQR